jgi:hypothetical protein
MLGCARQSVISVEPRKKLQHRDRKARSGMAPAWAATRHNQLSSTGPEIQFSNPYDNPLKTPRKQRLTRSPRPDEISGGLLHI